MKNILSALDPIVSRVRNDITATKSYNNKPYCTDKPLTRKKILAHLEGKKVRGVYLMKPGESTTSLAVLDLDDHDGTCGWPKMIKACKKIFRKLEAYNIYPVAFRSSGGHGIHIYMIWEKPQDAKSVRLFLGDVLADAGLKSGAGGVVKGEVEIFPKQDHVPRGKYGSMIFLPLFNKSVPLDAVNDFVEMPREYIAQVSWKNSMPVPLVRQEKKEKVERAVIDEEPDLSGMLSYIDPNDYDRWIDVGLAVHHETDGSDVGFSIWDRWSETSYKYNQDEMQGRWESFSGSSKTPVTIGTLRKLARENGWKENVSFDNLSDGECKFKIHNLDDFLSRPAPEWRIEELLPETGLAMIFGETGSGKTFFTLDLLFSIARGTTWRGLNVRSGGVIYIAAEGAGGATKRMRAYAHQNDISPKDLPFGIIDDAPNLLQEDHIHLIRAIQERGGADVIVIDTMAQTTPGANENAADDMGRFLANCKAVQKAFNALVVIIHHAGKDSSRGARGWSGIKAAMDTEVEIKKTGTDIIATVTKQKDGESGNAYAFKLVPVVIFGPTGEEEKSCIVQHIDELPKMAYKPTGKWQKALIEALNENLEPGQGMPLKQLIDRASEIVPVQPDRYGEHSPPRRKEAVTRALSTLMERHSIHKINGRYYQTPQDHKYPHLADLC